MTEIGFAFAAAMKVLKKKEQKSNEGWRRKNKELCSFYTWVDYGYILEYFSNLLYHVSINWVKLIETSLLIFFGVMENGLLMILYDN